MEKHINKVARGVKQNLFYELKETKKNLSQQKLVLWGRLQLACPLPLQFAQCELKQRRLCCSTFVEVGMAVVVGSGS